MHRCYDWVFWLSVWDNETRCMFFYANFYLSVCIMRSFVLLAMSVCIVCVSVRVSDWKIFYWNTEFWNESWIFITLIIPTAPTSSQAETRPTYLHSLKSLTSIVYQNHSPRLNLFSSQNRQIKVSLASDLWSSLMYGFTTYHYINRKTQTWWVTCSVFRVVLSSLSHTRKTSEGTTQKITHLYFHISRGKIKMQHEEATRLNCHICHLWREDGCLDYLGGEWRLVTPQGYSFWTRASSVSPRRAFKLAHSAG